MKKDSVHTAFAEECLRRDEAQRRVRKRVGRFSRMIFWFGFLVFAAGTVVGLYIGTITSLMLLEDFRTGWLPGNYFAGGLLILVVMPAIVGTFLLRRLWSNRPKS
jgi:H+/Cl- antiporter ClcA